MEGHFDLVTNFFTSLGYFDEPRAMERIVEDFSRFLKPGGHLVLDYLNPEAVANALVPQEQITKKGTTFDIHRRIHNGWIEKSIRYTWDGESCHHVERVQALTKPLFSRFQTQAWSVHTWGNYQLDAWEPGSPRTLILAQNPSTLTACF